MKILLIFIISILILSACNDTTNAEIKEIDTEKTVYQLEYQKLREGLQQFATEGDQISILYDERWNVINICFIYIGRHGIISTFKDVVDYLENYLKNDNILFTNRYFRISFQNQFNYYSSTPPLYYSFSNFNPTIQRDSNILPENHNFFYFHLNDIYSINHYDGIIFENVTILESPTTSEAHMDDFSDLLHFPNLQVLYYNVLSADFDEDIFIQEIKQFIPPDCEIIFR